MIRQFSLPCLAMLTFGLTAGLSRSSAGEGATTPAGNSKGPISLIDPSKKAGGWEFDNGREFPGAKGSLELSQETYQDKPILELDGDFTGGGNYVQAMLRLPPVDIETLSFWVNTPPGASQLPIRLIDISGQCHQLALKINNKGGWQHIRFPVEEYFETIGTTAAPDIAAQYEYWGGKKDSRFHQPGKAFVILFSRRVAEKGTILLSDVILDPTKGTKTKLRQSIPLDDLIQAGELDWGYNPGSEFKGATGGLDLVPNAEGKRSAMRLRGDFSAGGAYVGLRKSFAGESALDVEELRLRMKASGAKNFSLRLVDGTGQTHQRKGIKLGPDGEWADIAIKPESVAGGEHWSGANDGKWHPPLRLVELMLNTGSGEKPEVMISAIHADVIQEVKALPPAFVESFEAPLPNSWSKSGDVHPAKSKDSKGIELARSLEQLEQATSLQSPRFEVNAGPWMARYTAMPKLHSPDNSYHAAVSLDVFGPDDQLIENIPVAIHFGSDVWKTETVPLTLPRQASTARWRIQLNKTYGQFALDDLSLQPIVNSALPSRVDRIRLAGSALGNLFLPEQSITIEVAVEAHKPLLPEQRECYYTLRDYWGAEQAPAGTATLEQRRDAKSTGGAPFVYTTQISVPPEQLAVGKYYELHVEVPQEGKPATEYTGLAILPVAASKSLPAKSIPYTIRNWDSRIPQYIRLADRLGIRQIGLWGGWSNKPPYKPHLPGGQLVEELGDLWITGTPASTVERTGFTEVTEESLREGMRHFLKAYANNSLSMIALGNEPHGKGQKVLDNVQAYKAIYETVKAFDANIFVLGTSVEPNEEYFKAGYQNYLDAYDFHIYEHYTNVRRTMKAYRALMEKYDAVKPIHSTELGLNSQGQTRLAVSLEMVKKLTVFFAEGGSTVSWFTILYPDPKGKARGQFGDAHCVFDCKYSLYNPRLDAVTHYWMVNAMGDKRFVQEVQQPDGTQRYLFRNDAGECLEILWNDTPASDDSQSTERSLAIPFAAGQEVEVIRIDGSRVQAKAVGGTLSLSVSTEPLLLLYRDANRDLQNAIARPSPWQLNAKRTDQGFVVTGSRTAGEALAKTLPEALKDRKPQWRLVLPYGWRSDSPGPIFDNAANWSSTLKAPKSTTARSARVSLQLVDQNEILGDWIIPLSLEP